MDGAIDNATQTIFPPELFLVAISSGLTRVRNCKRLKNKMGGNNI